MGVPIFSAYTFSDNVQPPKASSQKNLILVAKDGSVHHIRYIKKDPSEMEKVAPEDFSVASKDTNIFFHQGDVEKARKILEIGNTPEECGKALVGILSSAKRIEKEYFKHYLLHDKNQIQKEKKKEERETEVKYEARAYHVLTGILATPVTMLQGIKRLASITMQAAMTGLNLLQASLHAFVVEKKHNVRQVLVETFKDNQKTLASLSETWTKDARQGLLQMIPLVGSQLANQYRMGGSLKEFYKAPGIGGILESANLSAPQLVYGFRSALSDRVKKSLEGKDDNFRKILETYYKKEDPSLDDAKKIVTRVRRKFPNELSVTVRIPTEKGRYHDATLMIAPGADTSNKTVVLYHGNMGHRNNDLMQARAKVFLAMGYNVLQASYAGDKVIEGRGADYREKTTLCNEIAMRQDAEADLKFLKELGVSNLGVYGYSLGGSQAMNFAQAVGKDTSLAMEYLVLDRTFTSMADVTSRTVKNALGSPLMGRISYDLAERFRISENGEGCDGLNNKKKLPEVLQQKPFEKTTVRIIGGKKDALMGDQENREENFSRDLFKSSGNSERIQLKILDINHRGIIDDNTFEEFLVGKEAGLPTSVPASLPQISSEGSEMEPSQLDG